MSRGEGSTHGSPPAISGRASKLFAGSRRLSKAIARLGCAGVMVSATQSFRRGPTRCGCTPASAVQPHRSAHRAHQLPSPALIFLHPARVRPRRWGLVPRARQPPKIGPIDRLNTHREAPDAMVIAVRLPMRSPPSCSSGSTSKTNRGAGFATRPDHKDFGDGSSLLRFGTKNATSSIRPLSLLPIKSSRCQEWRDGPGGMVRILIAFQSPG